VFLLLSRDASRAVQDDDIAPSWTLRKAGNSVKEATARLEKASVSAQNQLLSEQGIDFNGVPSWQRRGTGVHWKTFEKVGFNPKTKTTTTTQRRRAVVNEDLPTKEGYSAFIESLLAQTA
jgi:tRNA(His) guanylyltransferase